MGYTIADLAEGAHLLAATAAEAKRRASQNYLLSNRNFDPAAFVRCDRLGTVTPDKIRAVVVLSAGKGYIVDILIDGLESEEVFHSLPAFLRSRAEAEDKGFICLCALYQALFVQALARQGDGGYATAPFDLDGHEVRVTGPMRARAALLLDYFGTAPAVAEFREKLRTALVPFSRDGVFSPAAWLQADPDDRALGYFCCAALLQLGETSSRADA